MPTHVQYISEEHTLVKRQNWGPSKTPSRVRMMETFIVFHLFVLHSVTCLKTHHFATCFTILCTSISVFYVNTARDVGTVLLIFAKY